MDRYTWIVCKEKKIRKKPEEKREKEEKMKKRRKRVRMGEGSVWRSQTKRGRWEGEVGEVNREGKKGRDWTRQKVWKKERKKERKEKKGEKR